MPTATFAHIDVDVNDEGFFTDPGQWKPEMAAEIAHRAGIDRLTDRHWLVINFVRTAYLERGSVPTVWLLRKGGQVGVRELYRLFPRRPAKLAAKIAGIPKRHTCG